MTKCYAQVVHLIKHMNMVGALFGGGAGPFVPPLNPALAGMLLCFWCWMAL